MSAGPARAIPHRPADGLCPVNGIRDLVHWRCGRDWSNAFVWGLGQGGGFAYLRVKVADPPRQIFWGNATPRQHAYLADLLGAGYVELEGRAFKTAWRRAQEAVDAGTPPVIGPLDMFYLPFYPGIYRKRHIPIHFLLLVGYDDERAYVLDTGHDALQSLPLAELQLAWNVNAPGLGKPNRLAVLDIVPNPEPTAALVRRSIADQCRTMLHPPVSMLGVPAMEKVVREMPGWPKELGDETTVRCLRQVREYLNSPPDLEGDHLTAGLDRYTTFLEEAEAEAELDFARPIVRLREAVAVVPGIAEAIDRYDLGAAAAGFGRIAEVARQAFTELSQLVDVADSRA